MTAIKAHSARTTKTIKAERLVKHGLTAMVSATDIAGARLVTCAKGLAISVAPAEVEVVGDLTVEKKLLVLRHNPRSLRVR